MADLKRWIILHKIYLLSVIAIFIFAWMDAKQIKSFQILNTTEAWALYNQYTGPAIWSLWAIILVFVMLYGSDCNHILPVPVTSVRLWPCPVNPTLRIVLFLKTIPGCIASTVPAVTFKESPGINFLCKILPPANRNKVPLPCIFWIFFTLLRKFEPRYGACYATWYCL